MQLTRFRHKGLRQLHSEDNAKGVPPAMVDKLRKLLFALETAASAPLPEDLQHIPQPGQRRSARSQTTASRFVDSESG